MRVHVVLSALIWPLMVPITTAMDGEEMHPIVALVRQLQSEMTNVNNKLTTLEAESDQMKGQISNLQAQLDLQSQEMAVMNDLIYNEFFMKFDQPSYCISGIILPSSSTSYTVRVIVKSCISS